MAQIAQNADAKQRKDADDDSSIGIYASLVEVPRADNSKKKARP
jgi:hypothetical protein